MEDAKKCITFLGQPMGRALHTKLKTANDAWIADMNDVDRVAEVLSPAEKFGKKRAPASAVKPLRREELEMICFEYVSGKKRQ